MIPLINQFSTLQPSPPPSAITPEGVPTATEWKPIEMSFSEWIQALILSVKYKRELSEGKSSNDTAEDEEKANQTLSNQVC